MDNFVDDQTLASFKSRFTMRLELLRFTSASNADELKETKQLIQNASKGILSQSQVAGICAMLDQDFSSNGSQIANLITELNNLDGVTWQELSDFQEQFVSVCILVNEQPQKTQKAIAEALASALNSVAKKYRSLSKHKSTPPKQPVRPVDKYSTPALDAMNAAIEKFWLKFDPQHPPTQKQVSNFIAEQLGEEIKNRMTDELARAIKPEF